MGKLGSFGDHPAERFDHVHLWQEVPIAALDWYQEHLNAPVRPGFTPPEQPIKRGTERSWPALNQEGMFRDPRAGVTFGDVVLTWYGNQWDTPLVPSRGQLQDHIAFVELLAEEIGQFGISIRSQQMFGPFGIDALACVREDFRIAGFESPGDVEAAGSRHRL